jgi:hypothetical protein
VAATPSIVLKKTITYRGVTREFSNRYHFNGGTPADSAHWTTFADAVVAAEKTIYPSWVVIVEAIGYTAGSNVPVFSKTYSTTGTMPAGSLPQAGDVAALVRYATTARSAKNHPIYLFNYYHGVFAAPSATTVDVLYATQAGLMSTYATAWITGFSDGTTSYNRAGPNGATAVGSVVETYLTHRDFPR